MDTGLKCHIIVIIQYVATPSGVFITWLGIRHEVLGANFGPKTEVKMKFRSIGMAYFLQQLVQFELTTRGWLPSLFLQSNIHSAACTYYEKRGYIRARKTILNPFPSCLRMHLRTSPSPL